MVLVLIGGKVALLIGLVLVVVVLVVELVVVLVVVVGIVVVGEVTVRFHVLVVVGRQSGVVGLKHCRKFELCQANYWGTNTMWRCHKADAEHRKTDR